MDTTLENHILNAEIPSAGLLEGIQSEGRLERTFLTAMGQRTFKSFDSIKSDYRFFEQHSTEAKNNAQAMSPWLDDPQSIMDFGCGDGRFLERVLSLKDPRPSSISLIDVNQDYLHQAHRRLSRRFAAQFNFGASLQAIGLSFDLIVANHVLYYVPDLEKTLERLTSHLQPGGRLLFTLANERNSLANMTRAMEAISRQEEPYWYAHHARGVLENLNIPFERIRVDSELCFEDTPQARQSIARFVLGQRQTPHRIQAVSSYQSAFKERNKIRIPLSDDLIVVSKV